MGTGVAQWLRCCAASWKVAGSIPDSAVSYRAEWLCSAVKFSVKRSKGRLAYTECFHRSCVVDDRSEQSEVNHDWMKTYNSIHLWTDMPSHISKRNSRLDSWPIAGNRTLCKNDKNRRNKTTSLHKIYGWRVRTRHIKDDKRTRRLYTRNRGDFPGTHILCRNEYPSRQNG